MNEEKPLEHKFDMHVIAQVSCLLLLSSWTIVWGISG